MSQNQPGLNASHDWAKRVRNYREKHGMSVTEFARKAKLSVPTISAV